MFELPKIVFEIGINHNGSTSLANDIINMCLEVSQQEHYPEDLIFFKFQKRNPEVSTPEKMKNVVRVSPVSGNTMTYLEYKKEIEFGQNEYREFSYVNSVCGGLFVSVWDLDSVEFVEEYLPNSPYIKIPSAHMKNYDLINAAANTRIPLIISTGMSTRDDIDFLVRFMFEEVKYQRKYTLLSCTATYPCPDEEVNFYKLSKIAESAKTFNLFNYGFSSHSVSPFPAVYSNFYDVDMIEVHVTMDRALPGSDQSASLERNAVRILLRETLRIQRIREPKLFIFPSEEEKRKSLRG